MSTGKYKDAGKPENVLPHLNDLNVGVFLLSVLLPPRQIKSTVRLCQQIKNRRRQTQTFDQNNN